MSYARWSLESDIYSYPSELANGRKVIVCAACDLPGNVATTSTAAVEHVQLHVDRGDHVPEHLLTPTLYLDRGDAGVDS